MALPTDQTHQYERNPGSGESLLTALAAPPQGAVNALTVTNNRVHAGLASNPPATNNNTGRPAASVVAPPGPAPLPSKFQDKIKDLNDAHSIAGVQYPLGLSAAAPTGTSPTASVALSWGAPAVGGPVVGGYKVYKSVKSGAVWGPWVAGVPPTSSGTATTVTETGLSSGQVRFRVTATSGSQESPASNVITVTIP